MKEGYMKDFRITHYIISDHTGARLTIVKRIHDHIPIRLLANGDGWIYVSSDWIPVKFFIADILYRLDLQGKLP